MDEFWPRYGTAKTLRFSREWLGLFWLVLDHKKTHQQQIAERGPVALKLGFNRFKIAVNKFQFTLRREPGGIHQKLDLLF